MSDKLEFASPDVESLAWPATERRRVRVRPKAVPRPHRTREDRRNRHVLRYAHDLARRWEAGDEDVTMRDIINVLFSRNKDVI